MSESRSPLDYPEINSLIFYPRRDTGGSPPEGAEDHFFPVAADIRISARFYLADPADPHLLFFHGNGEIASDYDDIGPLYGRLGISFLAADYRGYGQSQGYPSVGTLLPDGLTIFDRVYDWTKREGRPGPLLIMGRSLGSAPAIEIAVNRLEKTAGLIIESGFGRSLPLLERMGIPVRAMGLKEEDGFQNAQKISHFTKPTLILHGQFDELIPPGEADLLMEKCGTEKKQLVVIPGAGHNDIMFRGGRDYFETIARFAQNLKRESSN